MSEDGRTVGIWVGEDDDLLDRVDGVRTESRSAWVKEAMRLRLAVETALDGETTPYATDRERRAFVRQAVIDAARSESDS